MLMIALAFVAMYLYVGWILTQLRDRPDDRDLPWH